jgi:hypothetical protein
MEFLETSAVGLDGIFNTCRLGLKWFEAVSAGTPVDLVVVGEDGMKQKFGQATVIGKVFGPYEGLAPLHAAYNHAAAHDDINGAEDPVQRLEIAMMRAYGDRFKPSEGVAFVYMIRTDTNEAGRHEAPQIVGHDPAADKDD